MIALDKANKRIEIPIQLTKGTEKTRIKRRSALNEYGVPVATRQEPFDQNCYVEWQIGYDAIVDDEKKLGRTTLKDIRFTGANGKEKALYELSEYIKYFYDWDVISQHNLLEIKNYLEKLVVEDFLDNPSARPEISINRADFVLQEINGFNFLRTQVNYPLLIYSFRGTEAVTEIIIKEKQYAIGVQPMLYFCIPITELKNSDELLGRTATAKEKSAFVIDENNIGIFLEMLKLFGTLSVNHNRDVISIINAILH